ncbi:ABC transporter ATP-binding protein [Amycolatopsis sp. 3B14]|uniref:ABC transporter ATP-binding protein n=1 Tax=Amycolatopsis sp. 3B14 TaxID=3243600 RepID=UPI003D9839CA
MRNLTTTITEAAAIHVNALSKDFRNRKGVVRHALDSVEFTVAPGRTTAVIGESGAGKSTLIRCVAGLEKPTSGAVMVGGVEVTAPRHGTTSPVQMVFQNPTDALNPVRSVGWSIGEPLRKLGRRARRARVAELMTSVGIDPARYKDRPKAFSGGQLQRIVIARALVSSPDVLLCDEPTSALDVSVQAQIINLLLDLQEKHHFACIVVTHDLAVARALAEDVVVLRHGAMLFSGALDEIIDGTAELDPYVRQLVRSSHEMEIKKIEREQVT